MPTKAFNNLDEKKRKQIDKSVYNYLKENSIIDVKVLSLMKEIGITRTSFYYYFINLNDFYFYCLKLILDEIESKHDHVLKLEKNWETLTIPRFKKMMLTSFENEFSFYKTRPVLFANSSFLEKSIFSSMDASSFSTNKEISDDLKDKVETFKTKADQILKSNIFNVKSGKDLDTLLTFVYSSYESAISLSINQKLSLESAKKYFEKTLDFIINGVSNKKG